MTSPPLNFENFCIEINNLSCRLSKNSTFNQLVANVTNLFQSFSNMTIPNSHYIVSYANKVIAGFFSNSTGEIITISIDYYGWISSPNVTCPTNSTFGPWGFYSKSQVPPPNMNLNGISNPQLHIREGYEVSTNVGGTLTLYPSLSKCSVHQPEC